jgi:hypothetical protein
MTLKALLANWRSLAPRRDYTNTVKIRSYEIRTKHILSDTFHLQ